MSMKKLSLLIAIAAGMISAQSYANKCLNDMDSHVNNGYLGLADCKISDHDMLKIVNYVKMHPEINSLDLDSNGIGDDGAKLLGTLSVEYLRMDYNFVG